MAAMSEMAQEEMPLIKPKFRLVPLRMPLIVLEEQRVVASASKRSATAGMKGLTKEI